METNKTETSLESMTGLPPKLIALEAVLSSTRPESDPAAKERTKAHVLLEICRQAAPDSPGLIETILSAGEERITISLREYVGMERFRAGVVGIVIGLIFGAILNVFGMIFLFMLLKIL